MIPDNGSRNEYGMKRAYMETGNWILNYLNYLYKSRLWKVGSGSSRIWKIVSGTSSITRNYQIWKSGFEIRIRTCRIRNFLFGSAWPEIDSICQIQKVIADKSGSGNVRSSSSGFGKPNTDVPDPEIRIRECRTGKWIGKIQVQNVDYGRSGKKSDAEILYEISDPWRRLLIRKVRIGKFDP